MTTECYVLRCTNPSTTVRVPYFCDQPFLSVTTHLCDHHAKEFSTVRPERFIHVTLEEFEVLKIKASL